MRYGEIISQLTKDLNESKHEELQNRVMGDVAGSLGLMLAYLGDRLLKQHAVKIRFFPERANIEPVLNKLKQEDRRLSETPKLADLL